MKNSIIEKVYSVYKENLPKDKDLYQAKQASPVIILEVRKEFGSYEKFKEAYYGYVADLRQKEAEKKTVKKGAKKDAK